MIIRWKNLPFEGPHRMSYWDPVKSPVVYAVMIEADTGTDSKSYRVIYFGHSQTLVGPSVFNRHRKLQCWTNLAGSFEKLFIAFHIIPKATREERDTIANELIEHYQPICNY